MTSKESGHCLKEIKKSKHWRLKYTKNKILSWQWNFFALLSRKQTINLDLYCHNLEKLISAMQSTKLGQTHRWSIAKNYWHLSVTSIVKQWLSAIDLSFI